MVTNVSIRKCVSEAYNRKAQFINENATVSGRNLYFPTDGLLLRERNVYSMGVFLPNDRDIMDLRGEEVLRLRASDDGYSVKYILVHMLDFTRAGDHACKYHVIFVSNLQIKITLFNGN